MTEQDFFDSLEALPSSFMGPVEDRETWLFREPCTASTSTPQSATKPRSTPSRSPYRRRDSRQLLSSINANAQEHKGSSSEKRAVRRNASLRSLFTAPSASSSSTATSTNVLSLRPTTLPTASESRSILITDKPLLPDQHEVCNTVAVSEHRSQMDKQRSPTRDESSSPIRPQFLSVCSQKQDEGDLDRASDASTPSVLFVSPVQATEPRQVMPENLVDDSVVILSLDESLPRMEGESSTMVLYQQEEVSPSWDAEQSAVSSDQYAVTVLSEYSPLCLGAPSPPPSSSTCKEVPPLTEDSPSIAVELSFDDQLEADQPQPRGVVSPLQRDEPAAEPTTSVPPKNPESANVQAKEEHSVCGQHQEVPMVVVTQKQPRASSCCTVM